MSLILKLSKKRLRVSWISCYGDGSISTPIYYFIIQVQFTQSKVPLMLSDIERQIIH